MFPSPPSPSPSRFIPIFCFRLSFLNKLARKRLLHKLHKGDFVLGYYHTGSFPPSPSHSRFISIFCFRPSFLYKLVRKRLLHKLHKGDFVLGYYHTGSLSELLIFFSISSWSSWFLYFQILKQCALSTKPDRFTFTNIS